MIILIATGLLLVVAFAYSQEILSSKFYLAVIIALCAIVIIAYFHVPHKRLKNKNLISLPCTFYVIPGAVGSVLIGLCWLLGEEKPTTIIIGLGTGVVASIIVSVLIDIGNTKRKEQTDRALFISLNESIKQQLNKLIELSCLASTSLDRGMKKECHSFIEWTTILFGSRTVNGPSRKIAQMPYLDELNELYSAFERIQMATVSNENHSFSAGYSEGIAAAMQTLAEMRSALRSEEATDYLIYEKCRRFCISICSLYSGYDKKFKEEFSFSTCSNVRLKDDFGF